MERSIVLWKDGWQFALGKELPSDSAFRPVHLPHDWTASRPADPHASLGASQGWFPRGEVGWYRNEWTLKEKNPGRRFYLDFGGIWECADVWVNGKKAGSQRYGYTSFRLDVTDAVRAGTNTLLVRVDNTQEPADRWYSGCGIYRPVCRMEMDEIHLDESSVKVSTALHGNLAELCIRTGTSESAAAVLSAPDGSISASGCGCGEIRLQVENPLLWTAETPWLYRLVLRLPNEDALEMPVGLRTIQLTESGLLVNGHRIMLRGVCLHQDMGCLGIAATKEMWRDRLLVLKRMGCNALRLAHHLHSREMLDLSDELGFYVYSECFDKWHSGLYGRYFDRDWKQDLDAMVLRDRNRPSVILWGVGNEVENQGQTSMVETLAMLAARVRQLDPGRPVTYAMNPHFKRAGKNIDFRKVKDIQKMVDEVDDREIEDMNERLECIRRIADQVDIIACNYQEQWFEAIHRLLPGKPILSTEAYPFFMGHYDSMQNYTERIPALFTEELPYTLGSFIWAGYDYLGESMGWPSRGWTGSLFRMDGTPRIAAHILKSHWTKEPMVHLSLLDNALGDEFTKAHWASPPFEDVWDFPDLHQGVIPYLIATNCDRVEIHCSGRVFHPPLPSSHPDGFLTGFVPWMPGKIEALGFVNNECVCRHPLHTPSAPAALSFASLPERTILPESEVLLRAEIVDAQGHPCIRSSKAISFSVLGDAEIIATENGSLMETTPYSGHTLPAWHGKASAVIRRTGPGKARIQAFAEGLQTAEIEWAEIPSSGNF